MTPATDRQAFWLLKNINKAIYRYGMIQDNDRVAVAVSGGKDSLSLLRLLEYRRALVPEKYRLVAIHIPADAHGPQTSIHGPLVQWFEDHQIDYHIEPLRLPDSETLPLDCHRCTWSRRRALFNAAARLGCNVVAFGHHKDDLAQTTLLNLFFHGRVETMLPRRDFFDGQVRVVRPLCLIEERAIRRYAQEINLPLPPPACPRADHSWRKQAAELIHSLESGIPNLKNNLLRASLYPSPCEKRLNGCK